MLNNVCGGGSLNIKLKTKFKFIFHYLLVKI